MKQAFTNIQVSGEMLVLSEISALIMPAISSTRCLR